MRYTVNMSRKLLMIILPCLSLAWPSCKSDSGLGTGGASGKLLEEADGVVGEKWEKLPVIKAKRVERIAHFDNGDFFGEIMSLSARDGRFYATDAKRNRVVEFDESFQFLRAIGISGEGPGELKHARFSFVEGGIVYVYGAANRGFAIYHPQESGGHSVKIPIPEIVESQFLVKDSLIFISSPGADKSITAFDRHGTVRRQFGEALPAAPGGREKQPGRCHLLPYDETSFFAIGEAVPVIRRYSYLGALIQEYDFREAKLFQSFFAGVEARRKRETRSGNGTYILFQNGSVHRDRLFLSMYTYDEAGQASLDQALALKIEARRLTPLGVLDLSDAREKRWYLAMCPAGQGSRLLAFDYVSSEFHLFEVDF
jgi:hypothetical protein